jgi:polyhydroxybutyrate depolymerase
MGYGDGPRVIAAEMAMFTGLLTLVVMGGAHPQLESLAPGDHKRKLMMGELTRSYHIHIPPTYDPRKPAPVVLVLHGAGMNGAMMEWFCGLSMKADQAGFIAVYPNGTGLGGTLLTWNAGMFPGGLNTTRADDVAFLGKVLDDLATVVCVDDKRVYAAGISNGGMMAYRLAVEMPGRFAAIASVAGVTCLEKPEPKSPIPILHIHGTKDILVPFEGTKEGGGPFRFPAIEESLKLWCKLNGCSESPEATVLEAKHDKLKVIRKDYCTGKEKAPVILYVVEGGGHTWPGIDRHARFLGDNTHNIDANDLLWDFFRQFTLK